MTTTQEPIAIPPVVAPPLPPTLLAVETLAVRFGKMVAVNDVSFTLAGGDLLGLIGPNGAGKTTLMRAIAGLQKITHGQVTVMGQAVDWNRPDALHHIGFTPDTPPVYEELTVRDFLAFIAEGYGLSRSEAQERIDFWLECVWLTEKAGTKIKGLSRGMRQRVGIARTLIANPNLILLDEPAAGLDPAGRVQFRQLLVSLRQQGKALIVSSHILSDLADYCTHIGIMSGGRMIQFGTVAHVSGQTDVTRARYRIVLAAAVPQLAESLCAIENVSSVQVIGDEITLEFAAGREAAAGLLTLLVSRGLPVAAFMPLTHDLEAVYLKSGIRQVD